MGNYPEEDDWSLVTSPNLHPLLMVGIGVVGLYAIAKVFNAVPMRSNPGVTLAEARIVGTELGIDWNTSSFPVKQFRRGIEVEMEHGPGGPAGPRGDVTHGDLLTTGRIALAHLAELPDYYTRLGRMEATARAVRLPWLY